MTTQEALNQIRQHETAINILNSIEKLNEYILNINKSIQGAAGKFTPEKIPEWKREIELYESVKKDKQKAYTELLQTLKI
jgi:hypothetical protein